MKFLTTVQNLRITGVERPLFYLHETGEPESLERVHLAGLIEKGRLFLQEKEAGLLCVTQDQQKQALFLRASGSFVHAHKCEPPIIIRRRTLIVSRTGL
jgi:hypothetical protein